MNVDVQRHRQGLGHEIKRVLWGHEADARRWSCCAIFLIGAVVTDGGAHGASGWLDRW
jgi:hypothetical protein